VSDASSCPEDAAELAVTVSGRANEATHALARSRAAELGVPFLPRPWRGPLAPLFQVARTLLVFSEDEAVLHDAEGTLTFHPGLSRLRIKQMDGGLHPDHLLQVSKLQPGESVLDCTLGLGSDALVAARAVGPTGRVVGLEKRFVLYAVISEGLRRFDPGERSCRIEVRHADAAQVLRGLPADAFDCVIFDPMFDQPRRAQQSFDALRRHAEHAPLTPQMLEDARRISRRVVVKGRRYGGQLKALGLTQVKYSRTTTVGWARVEGHTPGPCSDPR
jgi:hypothetical protein